MHVPEGVDETVAGLRLEGRRQTDAVSTVTDSTVPHNLLTESGSSRDRCDQTVRRQTQHITPWARRAICATVVATYLQ